jgi:hypothetical protein
MISTMDLQQIVEIQALQIHHSVNIVASHAGKWQLSLLNNYP